MEKRTKEIEKGGKMKLTNEQLTRRLQLVEQNARGLIDELIDRGFHYIED